MIAKMYIVQSLLLLLSSISLTAGQNESIQIDCESITINCVCGIGETKRYVPLELKMYAVEDTSSGKLKCDGHLDPYQACANISCVFASNGSSSSVKNDEILSYFYPQAITIPPGGFPEGHRFARQVAACHLPALKNAAIKCWKWPNWMNCDINCIHGYALRNGTETITTENLNCRNSENVWKPHEIRDCEPFLNCNVQLVKPGNLKCNEPIDRPVYCDISCLDYGEYDATSLQKYECVDDTFAQTLPHCATLKTGVPLLPKPN